ncbi:MAG: type II toxin-antitoxin system RelE/ParE family toxin [Gammaproteobacteria bacterium]|nr:type II toxin-antitoxin system RelE/ParE family toxin [Gammaproteobacteria bacterium]
MKKLRAIFFKSETGAEPVKARLLSLSKEERKLIGEDIKTVQLGWPIGMPLVRSLGSTLWEVRSKLPSSRIARIIFFMDNDAMILLSDFIKKTQKTPTEEINLAKKRRKLYERYI